MQTRLQSGGAPGLDGEILALMRQLKRVISHAATYRRGRPRAIFVWTFCLLLQIPLALSLWLRAHNLTPPAVHGIQVQNILFSIALAAIAVIGTFIIVLRPGNRIGWLLCLSSLFAILFVFSYEYATYTIVTRPGSLPAGELAAWFSAWLPVPAWGLGFALIGLFFPNGHLPARRWRPVAALAIVGTVALCLDWAFAPGELVIMPFMQNPAGTDRLAVPLAVLGMLGFICLAVSILGSAVSLLDRYRDASGGEREQIKWLFYAASLSGLTICYGLVARTILGQPPEVAFVPVLFATLANPIAVGIAIFKYRLYDIDVIINRTLVYGTVTAVLGAVYIGSVLISEFLLRPLTSDSSLAIAASTLAVAALFQPIQNRIQVAVDRRFYRRKYDAERTIADFSVLARNEVDLERLCASLTGVVAETMQPSQVFVWLRKR